MAQTIQLFSGANTAVGFYSCFQEVFSDKKRVFMMKGGPGVGKSSFMREIGKQLEKMSLDCCYFPCSGDPDSIDMVTAPKEGFAILDATAPHSYDPVLPGAKETIISLGDFLNEGFLQKEKEAIGNLNQKITQHFLKCYRYLSAAAGVKKITTLPSVKKQETLAITKNIAEKYFPRFSAQGKERMLFASSYTPKGLVDFSEKLPADTVIHLQLRQGESPDALLRMLGEKALLRGLFVVPLANPLEPQYLDKLYLPEIRFLCTASPTKNPTEIIDGSAWLKAEEDDHENGMIFQTLTESAINELKKAKKLHDDLEVYYTAAMDFQRWQETLERVKTEIAEKIMSLS